MTPSKNRPYELFGSYLLFKKIDTDPLGELWRVGMIDGSQLGGTYTLRKITGGNRESMIRSAEFARGVVPSIGGTTIVKNQVVDVYNSTPYILHEYSGGRSLRHVMDRARGGANAAHPHPVPLDQAVSVVEKIALSLETTSNVKYQGQRLVHGGLIPQFVWITEDGEVRVAGQLLSKGLLASLSIPEFSKELGPYFAPELHEGGEPSKATEVYSLGALFYLILTGKEPPAHSAGRAGHAAALSAATLMAGNEPFPPDLRGVLDRSLAFEAKDRFPSPLEMKQALGKILHGGSYSPTTFNLAFYLSTLLKKEMEGEAIDREREERVNLVPYLTPVAGSVGTASSIAASAPPIEEPKSKLPMVAVIAVVAALGAGGLLFFLLRGSKEPTSTIASGPPVTAPIKPPVQISEPVMAALPEGTSTVATTQTEAAKKKAFEEAVKKKLQDEMMKLQAEFEKQTAVPAAAAAAPPPSRPSPSLPVPSPAATTIPVNTAVNTPVPTSTPQRDDRPAPTPAPVRNTPAPAPAPAPAPVVVAQAPVTRPPVSAAPAPSEQPSSTPREGDLIQISELDQIPETLSPIRPVYPPLAIRQRVEGTVIVSALISENGKVLDVKVLRGDSRRVGLDEAAIKAVRSASFRPGKKAGQNVRTWKPIPIIFQLN